MHRDPESCDIPFYVSEFVEREVGTDCDSLSKVGQLIEQLSESKMKLEEQVSCICSTIYGSTPFPQTSSCLVCPSGVKQNHSYFEVSFMLTYVK